MKKSVFTALLALLVLLSLTACRGGGGSGSSKRKGSTLESAVSTYYDAIYMGKMENIQYTAPQQYWDWVAENYDQSIEDIEKSYYEFDYLKINIGSNQKYCGDDMEITYEITFQEELSQEQCTRIHDDLEKRFKTEFQDVPEAYKVKVTVDYVGSKNSKTRTFTHYVCKIGKTWYLCNKGDDYRFTASEFVDFSKDAL